MSPADAAKLLDLPVDATPEQVEARFNELRQKLEDKIAKAPTPGLKEKYRASLADITTAFEQLTLAADSSDLPVLQRSKPAAVAPMPAEATGPAPAPAKPAAPAAKSGHNREFLLVAIIAIAVFAIGGWWIMKTRAESAEKARVETAAAAEKAALAESKARVEAESRASLVETKSRWDALEKDLSTAERKLAELKADARNTKDLLAPEVAELQARLAAHKAYVEWLQPYIAESPLALQLPKADSLLAAKSESAAALVTQLAATLATAEQAVAAQKKSLLGLGRTLSITSTPRGLTYRLNDAYGRASKGTTPATVQVPWGRAEVVITPPSSGWAASEHTLSITRDEETAPTATAIFSNAPARITSEPSGLRYELTNSAGLSRTGTTPADLKDVPTGTATLRVARPDWPDIVNTPLIAATGANLLTVEFAPGSVEVTSEPAGAAVIRGDRQVGTTPVTLSGLLPGAAKFTLRLKGHSSATVSADIQAKQTATAHATLVRFAELQRGQPYTVPDLGLKLVPIAPGRFTMGSPSSEPNRSDDERQTSVTLTRPFWLGSYEVTQAEWRTIMDSSPSNFKGDKLPVENVNREDAQEFCRRLTAREQAEGRLPSGYAYRLPTEAEWEYACRAGTTREYGGNGNLAEMGWYGDNSGSTTHPVGTRRANAWGLYDMHGNVWEWCADWYASYPKGSVTDPSGADSGSGRVLRGGGWGLTADFCRSANRDNFSPGSRDSILGFRLALSSVR